MFDEDDGNNGNKKCYYKRNKSLSTLQIHWYYKNGGEKVNSKNFMH